jgi:hypothetical protein
VESRHLHLPKKEEAELWKAQRQRNCLRERTLNSTLSIGESIRTGPIKRPLTLLVGVKRRHLRRLRHRDDRLLSIALRKFCAMKRGPLPVVAAGLCLFRN